MSDSILASIRDGNLEELNNYYNEELDNYTNLYEQYLEKMASDEKEMAEAELKPQIIEKNNLLINLANIFLRNNQRSNELIETDYQTIDNKTRQLTDLRNQLNNLESGDFQESQAEEVKAQKKIENISGNASTNKTILTVLSAINIILFAFLVGGMIRLSIIRKNS